MNYIYRLRFDQKTAISSHQYPVIIKALFLGHKKWVGVPEGFYYDVEAVELIPELAQHICIVEPPLHIFEGREKGDYVKYENRDKEGLIIPNGNSSNPDIRSYLEAKAITYKSKDNKAQLLELVEAFIGK